MEGLAPISEALRSPLKERAYLGKPSISQLLPSSPKLADEIVDLSNSLFRPHDLIEKFLIHGDSSIQDVVCSLYSATLFKEFTGERRRK